MSNANPQQLEAINHSEGPLLIIAGPGSGKTFTLVERIINLIQNHDVEPEALFVVTFTEKAAQELTTRISNRLLELSIEFNLNEMFLGTFHSVCLRIIEDYREYSRLKRSFVLMDQFDQQYYLYQNLNKFREIENAEQILGSDKTPAWSKSENLLHWINKVTEEAIDHNRLLESGDTALIALGECYELYQELLDERNALDFSTIQLEALNLLRNHESVLESLKNRSRRELSWVFSMVFISFFTSSKYSFILCSSREGIKSLTSYSFGLHLLNPPDVSLIDICGFSS